MSTIAKEFVTTISTVNGRRAVMFHAPAGYLWANGNRTLISDSTYRFSEQLVNALDVAGMPLMVAPESCNQTPTAPASTGNGKLDILKRRLAVCESKLTQNTAMFRKDSFHRASAALNDYEMSDSARDLDRAIDAVKHAEEMCR